MEQEASFINLLIVLLVAFAVPIVLLRFKRFSIPIVVGEIIAGIILGRSGLQLVSYGDPLLNLFAEFGFVFLMFLAGLEVDFSNFRRFNGGPDEQQEHSMGPASLGGLVFVLTLALSAGVGLLLQGFGLVRNPWMMALILSTTSVGVVMPILKERNLSSGRYGQSILVAALIADFGTMLLITVLVAVISQGLTLDILLIGVLFVAFFLLYQLGLFSNRIPSVRRTIEELSHATGQIKMRLAFAIMLAFVALSQVLGTEIILGAFLAGAMLSLLRTPDDTALIHQLEAIGFGFFIPLFFIEVGLRFDVSALLASPAAMLLVPILVVAAIVVKLIPGLLFRIPFSWREAIAAGTLLSARLSLIIAASAVGLRLGVITESVNAAIILVAIITVTLSPLIFNRIIAQDEKAGGGQTVIFGANDMGLQVAQQLTAHGEPVLVLDLDAQAVERARQHGLDAFVATPFAERERLATYLETTPAVICVHSDDDANYEFCEVARTTYGIDTVLAGVADPTHALRFEQLGVKAISATLAQATLAVLVVRNPTTYALLTRTDDDKEIWEVVVSGGPCVRKRLHQLRLPGDVLVLALRRNGDLLVPHGNMQIERGDRLTLAGGVDCIETVNAMFAS